MRAGAGVIFMCYRNYHGGGINLKKHKTHAESICVRVIYDIEGVGAHTTPRYIL